MSAHNFLGRGESCTGEARGIESADPRARGESTNTGMSPCAQDSRHESSMYYLLIAHVSASTRHTRQAPALASSAPQIQVALLWSRSRTPKRGPICLPRRPAPPPSTRKGTLYSASGVHHHTRYRYRTWAAPPPSHRRRGRLLIDSGGRSRAAQRARPTAVSKTLQGYPRLARSTLWADATEWNNLRLVHFVRQLSCLSSVYVTDQLLTLAGAPRTKNRMRANTARATGNAPPRPTHPPRCGLPTRQRPLRLTYTAASTPQCIT